MNTDLSPVFAAYLRARDDADKLFARIAREFPSCVTCSPGCSDCCHALFDLSLVEAMHINSAFKQNFGYGPLRSSILERASRYDRELTKIKRDMYRAEKNGGSPDEIMSQASCIRMRCPLLDENNRCLMYDERPITCRLYGVPVDIGGKSHVCGYSNFEPGTDYPTVQLAKIQARLEEMSAEIASLTGSRFELADVYVPLSMALLTKYDDAWLGIGKAKED